MIAASSIMSFRILAASVALLLLSACGETTRPIGFLSSLGEAGAGGDGAVAQGNAGDSALPASACESLGHCGGDLQRSDATQVPSALGGTEWVAAALDACQEDLPTQEAYDACDKVRPSVDGGVTGGLMYPLLPFEHALVIVPGSDGSSFDLHFRASAHLAMFFSATCRAGWAVALSCPALGRRIYESTVAESNVRGLRCADDDQGGCACDYQLTQFFDVPYAWSAKNGVISLVNHNNLSSPVAPVDYCVKGETLELSGHGDQMLFNPAFSVRTLELHPPTCTDDVQDGNETGVDCGGSCKTGCPACDDRVQNGSEDGVDCGGRECPDTCACFNGTQDPWEEGVDCGGPCALACSCRNGKHDVDELGIDCGGACQGRFSDSDPIACPH